ncbi:ABC transporter ATP-binding protein [Martelella alba]|uniref:ABC transporter ATP-binding protein n=1 Tax=Martelella alba TaxID=2590451 RepID=A0A506U253_9HYPH|nr:ABC transporter ATP-binding protein [Martelella alba]TPW27860.1 ABC transporter ATP-binding protein [Martelella alba]
MFKSFLDRQSKTLLVRLLSENLRKQYPWYTIAICAMLVTAGVTALSAWIMKDIVNETVVSQDLQRVLMLSVGVAVIFIVKGFATYIQAVFLSKAGNNIIAEVQRKVFNLVLLQDIRFFAKFPSSELVMRITNNAQAARSVIDLMVTSFVRDLFTLIGLVVVMIIQQPMLFLVAIIVGPISFYGVRVLTKKVREIMQQELASLAAIIQNVQDTATGIRVIKTFNLENYMSDRMDKVVRQVETRSNQIARLSAATSPIMETLSGLAIAGVIALSGFWVVGKGNTPGEMMSFITALLLAYEPAKRLARMRVNLEAGMVGVRMLYEINDYPVGMKEKPDAIALPEGHGSITFENVHFAYDAENPLFTGLNLNVPAGKMTALVGRSGGGKSTIVSLVMRLFDVDEGAVKIDGVDLRDITYQSLHGRMAYVGQDTFLFKDLTIRDNIRLGREGASDEEVIEAAKAANAHDFITHMPQGYDTPVADNGSNFSGGQRQRLAIARAILRQAEILILDEATSALDSHSEALIQEAIERLTRGRTAIVIAHRLSTVAAADNIVVVENGSIVEQGPPDELLSRQGAYRKLYEMQLLPRINQEAPHLADERERA